VRSARGRSTGPYIAHEYVEIYKSALERRGGGA
jgi:hypothetical protein